MAQTRQQRERRTRTKDKAKPLFDKLSSLLFPEVAAERQSQREARQFQKDVLADRQAKVNHSLEFFQKAAETFYERRLTQRKGIGLDLIEGDKTGTYHEHLALHLWTRKELYTTRRWLQAEITRLIRLREPRHDEARHRTLVRRREQLALIVTALADFKPLHDQLRRVRRQVHYGQTRRQRRYHVYMDNQQRKKNIRSVLNASRLAIGKKPYPEPQRAFSSYWPDG